MAKDIKTKKPAKKTIKPIDDKILDDFLKSHEAQKAAEAAKKHFANKIMDYMKNIDIKSLLHKNKKISFCEKKEYEYNDKIKAVEAELKKMQEHAKIEGDFTSKITSEYLRVDDKKEAATPKKVTVGKKIN